MIIDTDCVKFTKNWRIFQKIWRFFCIINIRVIQIQYTQMLEMGAVLFNPPIGEPLSARDKVTSITYRNKEWKYTHKSDQEELGNKETNTQTSYCFRGQTGMYILHYYPPGGRGGMMIEKIDVWHENEMRRPWSFQDLCFRCGKKCMIQAKGFKNLRCGTNMKLQS